MEVGRCLGKKGFLLFKYLHISCIFFLVQNDKLELLKKGSLQHLGENMLAFLLHIGASSHFPVGNATEAEEDMRNNNAIYFDILVLYSCTNFVDLLGHGGHIWL